MKILSLFDGISCGMLALQRAGISVECYDAFEIDKYAVTVSKNNYPDIVHHGNVFDGDFTKFKGYDLLLGGSPCTYWSIAKKGRETTSDGMGFKLFMEYVRALRESECKYFLYENNYSIHQNIKNEISKHLGVEPIMINSALLSAQNRKRCYWTNIPNVTQPDDLGIMLADVLENGVSWQDKSYCMTSCYHPTFADNLQKHRNTLVAEPIVLNDDRGKSRTIKAQYGNTTMANVVRTDGFGATMVAVPVDTINGKSHTIPATYYKTGTNLFATYGGEKSRQKLAVPVETAEDENGNKIVIGAAQRGRYNGGDKTEQHIEVRDDGKSNCLTTVQKDTLVCAPVRVGQYGKGGQGQRIYSVRGKSVTLSANGGGQGAKTGLYKIDLPDGDYIIKKLTPIEAERLQTLPDNYTAGISNTQRYKCIGNGWTVDVIAHILSFLPESEDTA
ncbi:MAG: DNA (cytosine-5-)-methyltransferase [Ruminococcus sp.]|uniref:DNA (cytosine-5-)-methyltransferase n=1 Tax=Ruminococcus sp. TaxID=41978 RepID=UPI0025E53D43|nr:DNA (cytosine-5-)-methyltransferase [Ruminococcus sp.]MBR1384169.1 DNA (cytosine-5-)-methyltransferase [Ruminococcus sp.]MBR1431806.1 DNA (cytosine-5-)-methyltransferase [Ruminococcus sp.]